MKINKIYQIKPIEKQQTYDWLLHKHYAHRIPPIIYAFGLYGDKLEGVCTFGMPCVQMNDGKCIFNDYRIRTLELSRLVVNEGLPKNTLSYFVSQCIKLLPELLCLVSFADPNNGHHGYIYQATNWIYTGKSQVGGKNKNYILRGRNYHGKTVTEKWMKEQGFTYDNSKTLYNNWIENSGTIENFGTKHRYLKFVGNKRQKKEMKSKLKYNIQPYPKGNNKRYDASYKIKETQSSLF